MSKLPIWALSALTLLVGRQEEHLACKKWVVGCWHGFLYGARCRFAYGPADATVTHYLLLQEIQIGFGFTFLVPAHPGSCGQNPQSRKTVVVVVHIPHTHTHTHTTVLRLYGFCLGQLGWAGTRKNIHSLTPIVVINHPLSASSIY